MIVNRFGFAFIYSTNVQQSRRLRVICVTALSDDTLFVNDCLRFASGRVGRNLTGTRISATI